MYLLLNKNKVLARFVIENTLGFEGVRVIDIDKSFHHPLLSDIQSFILNRKAPKHRQHIDRLLKICGCDTLEGYLDVSHALSLNDTIWVKRENSSLCWEEVSLYTHPFNTTIARIAFDGGMFGQQLSSTSPEFGTNGTFAKCWIRENGVIKLVKCGSEGYSNCGLEPYSEYYASQVLSAFGADHVDYGLTMRHGKLASKCRLFTSEDVGLVPFSSIGANRNLVEILNWYNHHKLLDKFAEMIVADALIFNQDRHLGNFGCLFDNNTGKIIGAAPLYDHNISLFCYATNSDIFDNNTLNDYISRTNLGPKLYNDFISVAKKLMTLSIRKKLINMQGFKLHKHPRYNLPDWRIHRLNQLINWQIAELLKH